MQYREYINFKTNDNNSKGEKRKEGKEIELKESSIHRFLDLEELKRKLKCNSTNGG